MKNYVLPGLTNELRVLMLRNNVTYRELSSGAGVGPNQLVRIKNNQSVGMAVYTRVCQFLNVPLDDLVTFKPVNNDNSQTP